MFELLSSVFDCSDIDECQVYDDLCEELKCFNTIGSYQCLCM